MKITAAEFDIIERALNLLPQGEEFKALSRAEQSIIVNASVAMLRVYRTRKQSDELSDKEDIGKKKRYEINITIQEK